MNNVEKEGRIRHAGSGGAGSGRSNIHQTISTMQDRRYLFFLDAYHMEDRLFLDALGRRVSAAHEADAEFIIVHGIGEEAERLLEEEGELPRRSAGVLHIETDRQAALVERAVRQFTQKLVSVFTDSGVAAVPVNGSDRGLTRFSDTVTIGKTDWIVELLGKRVAVIVSALAERSGQAVQVPPGLFVGELAKAVNAASIVCFTRDNRPGIEDEDGRIVESVSSRSPQVKNIFFEPEVLQIIAGGGIHCVLTSTEGILESGDVRGTSVGSDLQNS